MVKAFLVLLETTKLFFKVTVPLCIPTTRNNSYCCSTSSQVFHVNVPDLGHFNRWVVVSDCYCKIPFPNEMWNIFSYACHLYVFSGLHDVCSFINWVVCFLLLNFESLYIFNESFLSLFFIFSLVCGLSFSSLDSVYLSQSRSFQIYLN